MTGPRHQSQTNGTASRLIAGVLIVCWFFAPILWLWGAWTVADFGGDVDVSAQDKLTGGLAIVAAAIFGLGLPVVARHVAPVPSHLRTLANIQLLTATVVVMVIIVGTVTQP